MVANSFILLHLLCVFSLIHNSSFDSNWISVTTNIKTANNYIKNANWAIVLRIIVLWERGNIKNTGLIGKISPLQTIHKWFEEGHFIIVTLWKEALYYHNVTSCLMNLRDSMCGGEICITLEQTIDWWYFPTTELQHEEQIGNTYSEISLMEVGHYNIYVIVLLLRLLQIKGGNWFQRKVLQFQN